MIEVKLSTEDAQHLENFVEEHMVYCMQELDGMSPEEHPTEFPDKWSTYGPFCGCMTCESREYLMATFDWLRRNKIVDVYVED